MAFENKGGSGGSGWARTAATFPWRGGGMLPRTGSWDPPAGTSRTEFAFVGFDPNAPGGSHIVARVDASTAEGGAPLRVTFDASVSRAATGAPLSFAWDFGDGTTVDGGGEGTPGNVATSRLSKSGCAVAKRPVVEHVYTARGTFTARVTVSDGVESADAAVTITVDGDGLPDAPGCIERGGGESLPFRLGSGAQDTRPEPPWSFVELESRMR